MEIKVNKTWTVNCKNKGKAYKWEISWDYGINGQGYTY